LYTALAETFSVLKQAPSTKKHVIVLSDGETEAADFESLVGTMRKADISVSTVSIGSGSQITLMRSIAEWGQGRSYYTDDPTTIPKIFTGETKIVTQKAIIEKTMQPDLILADEMTQGIDDAQLPVVHGQVVTYPKPGARVLMRTIQGPLLAVWHYGLGRSVAFTSDLSGRWSRNWVPWAHYGQFAAQMVKWAQRKESQREYFADIDRQGEKGTFSVDITTPQNHFVNHMDLRVRILFPSGKRRTQSLYQIAPGRYRSPFAAEEIGEYYFSLFGSEDATPNLPQTFGFGVPYIDEFNRTGVNESLLESLAAITNGRVLDLERHPIDLFSAQSLTREYGTPLWPYLIMAFLVLLIIDVAARKMLNLADIRINPS
jgi:hypothetical protein